MTTCSDSDYVILRRGQFNFSDYERDETFALEADCRTCDQLLGFDAPVRIEDGVLTEHLSCYIARTGNGTSGGGTT